MICFQNKVDKEFKRTNGDDDIPAFDDQLEDHPDETKERHSSGESIDSFLSTSPSSAETNGTVAASGSGDQTLAKGILKRCVRRCFSESQADKLSKMLTEEGEGGKVKKSVRFNDVVQRQVFRSNSSILGQKHKNQKRNLQKQRRRQQMVERRASDGDVVEALVKDGFKISASFDSNFGDLDHEEEHENDSGVASSFEDQQHHKLQNTTDKAKLKRSPKRRHPEKQQQLQQANNNFVQNSQSDLMFDLDF